MSELDRLLAKARSVDPVPAGTIDRVEARLGDRGPRFGWGWPVGVIATLAVWALATSAPPINRSLESPGIRSAPSFVAYRLAPKPEAPVKKEALIKRDGPLKQVAPPLEPESIAEAPAPPPIVVEQQPKGPTEIAATPKAPSGRAQIIGYRPRATRELEIDWRTLEQEELSKLVRAIVDRRDKRALLAALDQERPISPTLLVARGQLRASAARCDEAVIDFESALEAGADEPSRTLALDGRARCRP